MAPLVVGRNPWDKEAIHRDLGIYAVWAFQPMTGNFAFAGIDMALWDLCGKECGQPLYRMLGGAMREAVDYFYYMEWGTPDGDRAPGAGRRASAATRPITSRPASTSSKEEAMLEALRGAIGPEGKIRIDVNQAWTIPQAVRLLKRWHERFDIDFVEAPVRIDPVENMLDLRKRVDVPFCVNEGLWREADAYRLIKSRCGDYLCYSQYWVGSLGRWHMLNQVSHLEGWQVVQAHPWRVRARPRRPASTSCWPRPMPPLGSQQTAQMMEDDILTERHPDRRRPVLGAHRQAGARRRGR